MVAVALSFAGFASVVEEETPAVSPRFDPAAAEASTRTTSVKTAVPSDPVGSVAAVAEIAPAPPTGGVVAVHPAGIASDTNVTPVSGMVEVRTGAAAASGPLFVTVMV